MNQSNASQNQVAGDARNERLGFGIGRENSRRAPSRLPQNKIEEHDYIADMHRRAEVAKAREFQQRQQALQSRIENQRKDKLENARKTELPAGNEQQNEVEKEKGENLHNQLEKVHQLNKNANDLKKAVSPVGMFKLASRINILTDMPYMFAIGAGLFKDILDFGFLGSLPVVGTVLTICASIFIFMMMILAGTSKKHKSFKGSIKKGGMLIGGTIVEILFGINFLPVETLTAGLLYFTDLSERSKENVEFENDQEEIE